MPVFSHTIHRNIYIFGLLLLVFSLPLSVFGMSFSQLILLGNWVLEGNFREKVKILKSRKSIWIFISIFIVHAFWLFPPQDYNYAYHDLRIKLPLLVLPLIVGTSKSLSKHLLRTILLVFTSGVLSGSLISMAIFIFKPSVNITNYRELSVFISHIRFSLMVAFSVFILFYYSFIKNELALTGWKKIIGITISVWFIIFLILLKSLTGLLIFGVVSYLVLWFFTFKLKFWYKWFCFLILLILPVIPGWYVYKVLKNFTQIEQIDYSKVDKKTKSGNDYFFNSESKSVENGKIVWAFCCEKELVDGWTKKSKLNYLGKDKHGNELRYTLVRYLTSKGLRKDSAGISNLNNDDIKAIENGVPNYIFLNEWKIYPMIYNTIWELYEYKNNKYAGGHSLPQRIEYLKAAKGIISKHYLFGVGTGNVQISFDKQYVQMKSLLEKEWRLRAHNQFVTFLLTFGVFGFVWILFAIFYPAIKENGFKDFLFSVFLIILLFSFINEDTIETQAGLTFFVFFYCLFLFAKEQRVVQTKQ